MQRKESNVIDVKQLSAEDEHYILQIKQDIEKKLKNIDLEAALCDLDFPIRVGKEMMNAKIKDKHRYYFNDELALQFALKEFFKNPYLPKRLARMLYIYDEDEKFTEAMDIFTLPEGRYSLGESARKRERSKETSTIEIEFKVLNKINHETSEYTDLPFMIKGVRLIPAD